MVFLQVFAFASTLLLIGCAAEELRVADPKVEQKWLSFLEDGQTKKADVLLRLGIPSAQFEGEKILTYRLVLDDDEGFLVVSREVDSQDPRLSAWWRAEYNLVLIFDERHILQKHSLLKIR